MSVVFRPAENRELLQKVGSLLHDAPVVDRRWIPSEQRFVMELKRIGYEHGFVLSEGPFGFGRRWMYPWVKCELELSPIVSADEERHTEGTEDFDAVMNLRLEQQQLTIHREFSDVSIRLLPQSVLRLTDSEIEINENEGMVVVSRNPLDLSYIRDLLGQLVKPGPP